MSLRYLISAILCVVAFHGKAQEPVVVDEIIAKVDNYIVLKSELERTYLDAVANGANPQNLRCYILSSMIQEKLMVAMAEIDSVIVTDAEVDMNLNRRIEFILNQYNGSEEMILQYYGKTLEDIRTELRPRIKEQLTVERMQQHLTQDIKITPAETRRFFKKIPSDSLPFYDMEVKVGQITLDIVAGEEEKKKVYDQLVELRKRAVNGEDFSQLAKDHSQGPSAPNGGDLGWVSRGDMVPEFEAGALALRPGEVSMPVETQFGLHLIKLDNRRGNEYQARHILIKPIPSEKDIEKTTHFLDSLRTQIESDSVEFEKMAIDHSEDEITKGNGGYFMSQTGSSLVSIRELAPEIYFAIDSMEINTLSKPLLYDKEDGSKAARILFYKESRDPHQASLEQDWQKIQTAALSEKKNNALIKWFREAQNEVFINIDEEYDYCGIIR